MAKRTAARARRAALAGVLGGAIAAASAIGLVGPAGFLGSGGPAAAREMLDRPVAVLQALDKVTARVSTLFADRDETVGFRSLAIRVRACREAPPLEPPESAAFVEIVEADRDGDRVLLYSGWMFASSPAVAALEHPVYDLWVTDCLDAKPVDGAVAGPIAGPATTVLPPERDHGPPRPRERPPQPAGPPTSAPEGEPPPDSTGPARSPGTAD